MKMVQKSRTPSFTSQPSNTNGIRQRKNLAMGKQGPTSVTKNPGSKGTGGKMKIKTPH